MSWHDIDSDRHRWLLENGLSAADLRQFFKSQFRRLLAEREKLRNEPATPEAAVNAILRLKDPGRQIFQQWLRTRFGLPTAEVASKVAQEFRARESGAESEVGKERHELARTGLLALYSEVAPPDWLALLKTPMNETQVVAPEATPPEPPTPERLSDEQLEAFFRRLFGVQSAPDDATPFDPIVSALGSIPLESRFWSNQLKFDRTLFPGTAKFLDETAERRASVREVGTKPQRLPVEHDLDDVDLLAGEVIAQCVRIIPHGPAFLDVVGFATTGRAFSISRAETLRAVPEEGRVILHPDAGLPKPQIGELCSYRVEEMNTPNPIKVKATALGIGLYRVEHIPFQSSDYDSVRGAIKSWAARPSYHKVLFVTQDGLCIRSSLEPVERLSVDSAFDEPMDAWATLPSVLVEQSEFVVGPLPAPTSAYDCSALITMTRRMLRRAVEHKVPITKAQIQSILEQLPEIELNEQRRARFSRALRAIDAEAIHNQEIIEQLLGLPNITAEIERRKQTIIEESSKAARDQTAQLTELRRQRSVIEGEIDALEEQKREMIKGTRTAVRKAFESARKQELDTIERFAILPAFLSDFNNGRAENVIDLPVRKLSRVTLDLTATLIQFGILEPSAMAFTEALRVAVEWRLPVVIEGAGASQIARNVAQFVTVTECLEVNIPIGLISSRQFEEIVKNQEQADVLLLQAANASDLASYAPQCLDNVVQSVFVSNAGFPAIMILSGLNGVAALPWPREIQDVSLKLNLDIANDVERLKAAAAGIDIGDTTMQSLPPMRRRLIRRLMNDAEERTGDSLYLAFFGG
jgi:hypothetical protein